MTVIFALVTALSGEHRDRLLDPYLRAPCRRSEEETPTSAGGTQCVLVSSRVRANMLREVGPSPPTAPMPTDQQLPVPLTSPREFGAFGDDRELGLMLSRWREHFGLFGVGTTEHSQPSAGLSGTGIDGRREREVGVRFHRIG